MTHKRHTSEATEALVHLDLARRTIHACRRNLDKYHDGRDEPGDRDAVLVVRGHLAIADALLCDAADLLDGARTLTSSYRYESVRLTSLFGLVLIVHASSEYFRGWTELVDHPWLVGIAAGLVFGALGGLVYWGVGALLRRLDYRYSLAQATYPNEPIQHGPTRVDPDADRWVNDAAHCEPGSAAHGVAPDADRALAGVAWALTGSRRTEDRHLPMTGGFSIRTRLDGIRMMLGNAASPIARRHPRAYQLYVEANERVWRADAVLVHIVYTIRDHLDRPAPAAEPSETDQDETPALVESE